MKKINLCAFVRDFVQKYKRKRGYEWPIQYFDNAMIQICLTP